MINQSLLVSERPLKVKVIKIEGGHAKLSFSDNQFVEISTKYLPESSKVGDELYLNLLSEDSLALTKKQIAEKILENILAKDEE